MTPALLVALLALTVSAAGRFDRVNSRCVSGRSSRGLSCDNLAFIELAPLNGAGMTAACACTNVTGAKGEVVTVTRAGSGMCSRQGAANAGILNGDLVLCGSNLPRVEGIAGGLGIRTELGATNQVLRSAEIENAVWVPDFSSAPLVPTRSADFAVSPTGVTTADRVQFGATTGAEFSTLYQLFSISTTNGLSCSAYVKGTSGSGTTDICGQNATGGWLCSACPFVSDSWTRCQQTRLVTTGATAFCKLGSNSGQNGGIARTASDVLVWGFQGEERGFPTSHLETTSAPVTRPVDAVTMAVDDISNTAFCIAATIEPIWSAAQAPTGVAGSIGFSSPTTAISYNNGLPRTASGVVVPSTTFTAGPQRFRGYDDNTKVFVFYGANSSSLDAGTPADRFGTIFRLTGSVTTNAVVGSVQMDPDPSRCQ